MDSQTTNSGQLNSTDIDLINNIKTERPDQEPERASSCEVAAPIQPQESNLKIKTETLNDGDQLLDDGINQLLDEVLLSAQSCESNLNEQDENKSTEDEESTAVKQVKAERPKGDTSTSSTLAAPLPCEDDRNLNVMPPNIAALHPENIKLKDEGDAIDDDDITPERVACMSGEDGLMLLGVFNRNADTNNVNSVNTSQPQPQCESESRTVCDRNSNVDAPISKISVVDFSTLIETTPSIASSVHNDDKPICSEGEDNAVKSEVNSEIDENELLDYFDNLTNSPRETGNIEIEEIDDVIQQGTSKTLSDDDLERKLIEYKRLLKNFKSGRGQSKKRNHSRSKKRSHHKNSSSSEDDGVYSRERSRSQQRNRENSRSRKRSRDKDRNKKRHHSRSRSDSRSRNGTLRRKKGRKSRSHSRSRNERRRRGRESESPKLIVRSTELPHSNIVKFETDFETVPETTAIPSTPPRLESRATKLEKTLACVQMQQEAFRLKENSFVDNRFVFTQTMRMNPTNANLKNYSPLCNLHNVAYACTSIRPRVPLLAYGLSQPTRHIVNVMRIVCIGFKRLEERSKLLKMPPKLLRMLKTANEECKLGQRDAKCQTDAEYFNRTNVDVATQYCNKNLIDISQMNDRQKYAIYLCEEMVKMQRSTDLEESQQNRRMIDAISAARGSLSVTKREY